MTSSAAPSKASSGWLRWGRGATGQSLTQQCLGFARRLRLHGVVLGLEQLVDELLGIEGLEVFGSFAQADEAGGHAQLLVDRHQDAALSAAI
jgi:hypothetical protein